MMLKNLMVGALLAGAVFTACSKDDDVVSELNQQDRAFLNEATQGNLAQIELGELAIQQGLSDSIQMFGQMMVTGHTMAHEELDSIATQVNAQLPTALNAEQMALRNRLQPLAGMSFDTAYINAQVLHHQRTIELFETQESSGMYAPLRQYASKYLLVIREHYQLADSIANSLQ